LEFGYRTQPSDALTAVISALSGRADLPDDVRSAALEVVRPLFIPDSFTLVVPSDQFKRPCLIVRRKEKWIGVAFG
jgi:hypothetical protein